MVDMSEMISSAPARVAPAAEGPELTEHVNVLMTEETRAFLLGSKITDAARSEGAVARALLADAIRSFEIAAPAQYAERIELGRQELARRARPAA